MDMVRGSYDGAKVAVERRGRKQRITADEVHAARDLLMSEWRAMGRQQEWIGGVLGVTQQHVSQRLQKLPAPFHDAVRSLVQQYPDGLPQGVRARIEQGISEWRRDRRERARAGSGP